MKKILITGSEGYIGKHLIKVLGKLYAIDTVDILDIKDPQDIRTFSSKNDYDTVIHLAALVKVNESVKNPLEYYDNNINGTINILKNVNFKNFIFASTGAAEQPNCPYALSKKVCEDIVEEHCVKNKKTYTTFRFYNVIGTDGFPPTNPDGLFFNLIRADDTGVFNIYGNDYNTVDGTAVRDYVHVNEICYSLKEAINNPSNKLENLGHGIGYSVKEIADIYKQVNNSSFEIIMCPRRNGDLERTVLDNVSKYMKKMYSIEELCTR